MNKLHLVAKSTPPVQPQSNSVQEAVEPITPELISNHRFITFLLGGLACKLVFMYNAHNIADHIIQAAIFIVMFVIASQLNKARLQIEHPEKEII